MIQNHPYLQNNRAFQPETTAFSFKPHQQQTQTHPYLDRSITSLNSQSRQFAPVEVKVKNIQSTYYNPQPVPQQIPTYQPVQQIYQQPPIQPSNYIPRPQNSYVEYTPPRIQNISPPRYPIQNISPIRYPQERTVFIQEPRHVLQFVPLEQSIYEFNKHPEFPFRQKTIEDLVVKAIVDLALYERDLEDIRVELASNDEFRIQGLFQYIEQSGNGQLSPEELMVQLKQFALFPDIEDIQQLFNQYGSGDRMDYQQFFDLFMPKSNVVTKCHLELDNDIIITPEIKTLVRKFFAKLLSAESAALYFQQSIYDEMQKTQEFDLSPIYEKIFVSNHFDDLKHYLQTNGNYFDKVVLIRLFERFDVNKTGLIMMEEFERQLLPRQVGL